MSVRFLLFEIHLHDNRWHGCVREGVLEWPPSPMRLFQALLAASCAGRGGSLAEESKALDWLAGLDAPVIAAPASKEGRTTTLYVPNNDLDAVGGDPANIGGIRDKKLVRPRFLGPGAPFLYLWSFDGDTTHAETLIRIAARLYQFGRGVDMAYANAELLDPEKAEERLVRHPGPVWRPASGGSKGVELRCPNRQTLRSLIDRYKAQTVRLKEGALRQAHRPRYRMVGYECPPTLLLFDLKPRDLDRPFHAWPLTHAAELTTAVRDGAVRRLKSEMPSDADKIERVLIGRNANEADKAARVRIVPLPSVGTPDTNPSIRRVLVERPPDCPIRAEDLAWAFSGLDLNTDYETGEILNERRPILQEADDRAMLRHYGAEADSSRIWQTVTPVALPVRRQGGRRDGAERVANETEAAFAAWQALRHAGIATQAETVRVQREPFFGKGARAEDFAGGTRFDAARLWHVEIEFGKAVSGPLVIGDGRYCGLGLMAPVRGRLRDVLTYWIEKDCRPPVAHQANVVNALRRALMSQEKDLTDRVSTLFSGHESDPGPARSGHHRHVYLFADDVDGDGLVDRLGIIAPWRVDRSWTPNNDTRALFEKVAGSLELLRAGMSGVLTLRPAGSPDIGDPIFAHAQNWISRTPYRATRHTKRIADTMTSIADDLLRECLRRGFPRPHIEITGIEHGPRGGIFSEARLRFHVAVVGPILLGSDAHRGGGMFSAVG